MATAASMTYKESSSIPTIQLPESLKSLPDCHTNHRTHIEALKKDDAKNMEKCKKQTIILKETQEKEAQKIRMTIERRKQEQQQETPHFSKPKKPKQTENTTQPILPPPHGWPMPHPYMGPMPSSMYGMHPGMQIPGPVGHLPPNINPIEYQKHVQMMMQYRAAMARSQMPQKTSPGYPMAMTPGQSNPQAAPVLMGPPSTPVQKPAKTNPNNTMSMSNYCNGNPIATTSSQGGYGISQHTVAYPTGQEKSQNDTNNANGYYEQHYDQAYRKMVQSSLAHHQTSFKVPMTPTTGPMKNYDHSLVTLNLNVQKIAQNPIPVTTSQSTPQSYYPMPTNSQYSSNEKSKAANPVGVAPPPPSYPQARYGTGQEKKNENYMYPYSNWPQHSHQPPPYYPQPPSYPTGNYPQNRQPTQHSYYNNPQAQSHAQHFLPTLQTAQNLHTSQPSHGYPQPQPQSSSSVSSFPIEVVAQNQTASVKMDQMDEINDDFISIQPTLFNDAPDEDITNAYLNSL